MNFRSLLYQAMAESENLVTLLGSQDRLVEASALGNPQLLGFEGVPPRPFVTYRMNTEFWYQRLSRRAYSQIWVNDDPGDYLRIDEILEEIRKTVIAIPNQGTFIKAEWIETSVDLKDDVMGTINKYIRFQFTGSLPEEY